VLVSDFEFPLCFGGLVSDGLRLSGTLRPTVGKGGGWLGKGSANRPGELPTGRGSRWCSKGSS